MVCSIDDELRKALDLAQGATSDLGLRPYSISVVRVYTTGSRPGVGSKNTVETPLALSNGGNHAFRQLSAREIVLSNNLFSDQHYVLGPLVLPFSGTCGEGGTDPILFENDVDATPGTSQQLYFKVTGPGMVTSGSYFKLDRKQMDSSLTYKLYLKHTGERIA